MINLTKKLFTQLANQSSRATSSSACTATSSSQAAPASGLAWHAANGNRSGFDPNYSSNKERLQFQAPEVREQWDAMKRPTESLRQEMKAVQAQMTAAMLRGDTASLVFFTQKFSTLDHALKARSAPSVASDQVRPSNYTNHLETMSDTQLNDEWATQALRSVLCEFRGDKAGAAAANQKLGQCQQQVERRVDNELARLIEQLGEMSDAEVQETQSEASEVMSGGEPPKAEDLIEFLASTAELAARKLGDELLAPFFAGGAAGLKPFKALGELFKF